MKELVNSTKDIKNKFDNMVIPKDIRVDACNIVLSHVMNLSVKFFNLLGFGNEILAYMIDNKIEVDSGVSFGSAGDVFAYLNICFDENGSELTYKRYLTEDEIKIFDRYVAIWDAIKVIENEKIRGR